jgi:hypothetical protein
VQHYSVQISGLDVYLVDFPIMMCGYVEDGANGCHVSGRGEGLYVIESILLSLSVSH